MTLNCLRRVLIRTPDEKQPVLAVTYGGSKRRQHTPYTPTKWGKRYIMSYNEIVILVSIVLSIAAIYAFGWVCWNQGYHAGNNDGIEAGRLEVLEENLIRADRSYWLNGLKDEKCLELFDACVSKS